MNSRILLCLACAVAGGMALFHTPAQADSVADFYKGKDLKLVVGSDAGGGYDVYARALARHFAKHLPGTPNIIVQNMQGAGGVVATNWLYNVSPKDGTVFGMPQRGTPFLPFFGKPGPQFDPVKFNWIGSLNNETGVITLWHTAKVKTLKDALEQESLIGGSGPNDTESYPALMDNTIGTKFRIISGYPSTTAISLAMERGEVDGLSQSWSSLKSEHPDWVKNKTLSILVQVGSEKHPDLPDVPTIMEYVRDPEHKAIWNIMLAQKAMGRPFAAPPGVPEDRVKALRAAFDATVKDPAFTGDLGQQGRELTPVSGLEIQKMLQEVAAQPKALLAKIDDYITYKGKKEMAKVQTSKHAGKIAKIEDGGRAIVVSAGGKDVKSGISGSRTELMLDGKKTKRDQLKVGMTCTVTGPAGSAEAAKIDCKSAN